MPLMVIVLVCFGNVVKKAQIQKLVSIKEMGAVVEEAFSAVKLIVSFAREDLTLEKFDRLSRSTQITANKAAILSGTMHGAFLTTMFGFYTFSYFIGTQCVINEWTNPTTQKPY